MVIYFDQQSLQLNIKAGALEEYTPTDEIRDIVNKSEELKKKRDEFLENEFNPEMKKLLDCIDRINKQWNPELRGLGESGKPK